MLRYTGQPLIDIGIATIVALRQKNAPEEITKEDLHATADYLEGMLFSQSNIQTHLLVNYINAVIAQPAYNKPKLPQKPTAPDEPEDDSPRAQKSYQTALSKYERDLTSYQSELDKYHNKLERFNEKRGEIEAGKREYLDRILRGFEKEPLPGQSCGFCGAPAVDTASRTQAPLLTGDSVVNFTGRGVPGVPICGTCMLALHTMALGSYRCQGRVLFVTTDDSQSTLRFVRHALQHNLKAISMGTIQDIKFPKTRIIELIQEVQRQAERWNASSVTGYLITNYGPKPDINIYTLPSVTVAFLQEATYPGSDTLHAWNWITTRNWNLDRNQPELPGSIEDRQALRNNFYEALFDLPERSRRFFRRFIKPAHSWALAELFLRKVMHMDQERLQLLYELGNRFAEYIRLKRSFYFDFGRENRYSTWRRKLLRAADDYARQHNGLLITADEFVRAFTAPSDAEFNDWRLARDIVMLRIIELRLQSGELTQEEEELLNEQSVTEEAE